MALVDVQFAPPSGEPCEACGAPVEPLDKFCPACGTPQAVREPSESAANASARDAARAGGGGTTQRSDEIVEAVAVEPSGASADAPLAQKYFRCQKCAAEVATSPDQRSYVCPFCDSTYVVEFSPEQTGRQRPEFVIGFEVTPENAQAMFHRWIRTNGLFRPGDLALGAVADKMKGVYLPFWSFAMLAESDWQASIGEYWYRTETYTETDAQGKTVTKTRQVTETEWWPLSGRHHAHHTGYLVSGSRGLAQYDADRIQPFQLPALRRFEPFFLAGWLCEEYSVDLEEALRRCQDEFHRREQGKIAAFLPGNTHRGLEVNTVFSHVSSDLCLLPVYVLSYHYRGKLYRFLVNGQTGKMAGDKPISWTRVLLALGIGVGLIGITILLLSLLR